MRVRSLAACGALLVLLAGCDHVASTHPVGETPLPLEESDWQGVWVQTGGSLTVRIVDAEKGVLEAGWVEEKDDTFVLETVTGHLRTYQDWTFASFTGVEDAPGFLWCRLELEDGQMILWWPRPGDLARLVEQGLLPGRVEDGDVMLERLGPEHLAILVGEEHGVLFQWDEPMVFRRLP